MSTAAANRLRHFENEGAEIVEGQVCLRRRGREAEAQPSPETVAASAAAAGARIRIRGNRRIFGHESGTVWDSSIADAFHVLVHHGPIKYC